MPHSPKGISAQAGALSAALAITLLLALIGLFGAIALYLNPIPYTGPAPTEAEAEEPALLRLVGSNTIGGALAPALARAYLEQRLGATGVTVYQGPGRHEQRIEGLLPGAGRARRIEVAATGSGFAFDALENGTADVGLSSRAVKAGEQARPAAPGDPRPGKSGHVLGLDGIAVIVHPGNPVAALSLEQVGRIFDGTLKNWRELGGLKLPIHRYARNRESGTYQSFLEMVLDGRGEPDRDTRYIVDSHELSEAVAGDPNGIGFVALPYIGKAKALKLSVLDQTAFAATPLTVYREDYPLSRRLYLYANEPPDNPLVADFLEFALSPAGQALVEEAGFVGQRVTPVAPSQVLGPLPADAPPRYVELTRTADAIPFTIRFKADGTEPDNKAWRDLPRLMQLLRSPRYRERAVILATFGAGANDAAIARVKAELERNGVKNVSVENFGQALPVAPTDTPEGRGKNRRVELWLAR